MMKAALPIDIGCAVLMAQGAILQRQHSVRPFCGTLPLC